MRNKALRAAGKRRFCRSDQLCNGPLHKCLSGARSPSRDYAIKRETHHNGAFSGDKS
jgi:hypothetical protein